MPPESGHFQSYLVYDIQHKCLSHRSQEPVIQTQRQPARKSTSSPNSGTCAAATSCADGMPSSQREPELAAAHARSEQRNYSDAASSLSVGLETSGLTRFGRHLSCGFRVPGQAISVP